MPANLDTLPFDIFHSVACYLEIRDYVYLSRVCKKFDVLLRNDSTARCCLQRSIASTRLQRHVGLRPANPSFRAVIERIFSSREALRTAQPYSASIIAYGSDFSYKEGVLCYHSNGQIRLLDVYGCAETEDCIDTSKWSRSLTRNRSSQTLSGDLPIKISHLSYTKGILACLCEINEVGESWLVALDLNQNGDDSEPGARAKGRRLIRQPLSCTTKLFVKQDGLYLYYGTHSALGSHGHHEWAIQGINLATGEFVTKNSLQLGGFFGSEIGSTVCFGIHSGFFYAISNQTSLEVEEVDWTSQYHYINFALDEPNPDLTPKKIWRRQHVEGPINDSWTELSLQVDEKTDSFLIVECRKEYMGGGSANVRTYYTQPLNLSDSLEIPKNYGYPKNDPLIKTLDDNSKPNYEPPKKRISQYCHPEYPQDLLDSDRVTSREFILAKTKFRTYSRAASSFIDLVNDPVSRPGFARLRDRIRLRIASRVQMSPLIGDPSSHGHFLLRPKQLDENGIPIECSEEEYHLTEVQDLWPPKDAPAELIDVLCPSGRVGQIDAMADDNAIVYMTDAVPGQSSGERAIVLINFDPMWKHDGLKRINLSQDLSNFVDVRVAKESPSKPSGTSKRQSPVDDDKESPPTKKLKGRDEGSLEEDQQQNKPRQPRKETAQYLFNRGYWFTHE